MSISFSIYYVIMNLGFVFCGLFIDLYRHLFDDPSQQMDIHFLDLDFKMTYSRMLFLLTAFVTIAEFLIILALREIDVEASGE